jgi:hypothetical protein
MNNAGRSGGRLQLTQEPLHVFKSQLDSETLDAKEPGKRLAIIDWRAPHSAPAGSIHCGVEK